MATYSKLTHVFMGSLVLSYYKLYGILECRIWLLKILQLPLKYFTENVKKGIVEASYDFNTDTKKQTKLNK